MTVWPRTSAVRRWFSVSVSQHRRTTRYGATPGKRTRRNGPSSSNTRARILQQCGKFSTPCQTGATSDSKTRCWQSTSASTTVASSSIQLWQTRLSMRWNSTRLNSSKKLTRNGVRGWPVPRSCQRCATLHRRMRFSTRRSQRLMTCWPTMTCRMTPGLLSRCALGPAPRHQLNITRCCWACPVTDVVAGVCNTAVLNGRYAGPERASSHRTWRAATSPATSLTPASRCCSRERRTGVTTCRSWRHPRCAGASSRSRETSWLLPTIPTWRGAAWRGWLAKKQHWLRSLLGWISTA